LVTGITAKEYKAIGHKTKPMCTSINSSWADLD